MRRANFCKIIKFSLVKATHDYSIFAVLWVWDKETRRWVTKDNVCVNFNIKKILIAFLTNHIKTAYYN